MVYRPQTRTSPTPAAGHAAKNVCITTTLALRYRQAAFVVSVALVRSALRRVRLVVYKLWFSLRPSLRTDRV